jgi:hypothetical protein
MELLLGRVLSDEMPSTLITIDDADDANDTTDDIRHSRPGPFPLSHLAEEQNQVFNEQDRQNKAVIFDQSPSPLVAFAATVIRIRAIVLTLKV